VIERLGLSILLGMGALTLFMFLAGLLGLPIRLTTYLPLLAIPALDGIRRIVTEGRWRMSRGEWSARWQTVIELLHPRHPHFVTPLLIVILFVLLTICLRCVLLPNTTRDSLVAFDLLGRTIATEELFRVSLFDHTNLARGGSYPPFTALTFAWGYQAGLTDATQAILLPFIAFVIWIFGFARREMGATSAYALMAACLLSPDFYGFLPVPLTNLPLVIFADIAILYLFVALRDRSREEAWLSVIAITLCLWTRSDAVAFLVGAFATMLLFGRRRIPVWLRLVYPVPGLMALVLWQLYIAHTLGETSLSRFTTHLFWHTERMQGLIYVGVRLLFSVSTMGLAAWFLAAAMCWMGVARRFVAGPLLAATFLSLGAYALLFYQTDPVGQDPLVELLMSSYRRGIIVFVLPMWMAVLLSPMGTTCRRILGSLFRTT